MTVLALAFLLVCSLLQAQTARQTKFDSLHTVIIKSNEDTLRVNALNALASAFVQAESFDSVQVYAMQAMDLASKIGFGAGQAEGEYTMAIAMHHQKKYIMARSYAMAAIERWQSAQNSFESSLLPNGQNRTVVEASNQLNLKLSEAYVLLADYKSAMLYYKRYVALQDSTLNDQAALRLQQQRTSLEVAKAKEEEKLNQEKALAEQKFRNEQDIAEKKAQQDVELAREKLQQEKQVALEQIRYRQSLMLEKAERERMLELHRFESEHIYADSVTRHRQLLEEEKSRQAIRNAQLAATLQQVKAERQRRTEASFAGIAVLVMFVALALFAIKQHNQQQRAMEKAVAAHKMTELELQSLRAQLNPHFMFNSLNAIQDLILREENDKSQLYLKRFSNLLRMLLDNASQPFVTLRQELDLLKLYLSLEQLRIPDLQFSIEADPTVNPDERMTPNMILQPYIENAVWHGLSNKKGERRLTIRVNDVQGITRIQIEDNGIGRKKAAELKGRYRLGHKSKGMQLLSKRFELLSKEYGADIQATITDLEQDGEACGTLVIIDLPPSLSDKARAIQPFMPQTDGYEIPA